MPVLYNKNAKKHPDKQLKQIANSLREFGWRQPILVDRNDIIIVGHGRWMAYQKYSEGIKEPWIVKVDDLTDDQIKAYRLADNKLNESEWDMGLVVEELKDLSDEMFDLTGFDRDLLISPDEKDDIVPDNAPVIAKFGDLWALGKHRLLCGDSTKKDDVARLMGDKKADMVFTDPPYGINYHGMQNSKQWNFIENDDLEEEQFNEFLLKVASNFNDFSKNEAAYYICHYDKYNYLFRKSFEKYGYQWRATIIWVKNSPAFSFAQYKYKHEPILYLVKSGNTVLWYGDMKNNTVWKEDWDKEKVYKWFQSLLEKEKKYGKTTIWEDKKERGDHPTIKPVSLIIKALFNSSKQDNIVLDLFLGSGSTLIACEKTNRICYGMEIEPKYVDVIIKRWEDYTGQKAVKL